jgi:hypothetical protein
MLYRRCPRCALLLIDPRHQRDHRCPRCLMGDSVGVEMRPADLSQGQRPDGAVEVGRALRVVRSG